MKKYLLLLVLFGGISLVSSSCKKKGCTDFNACNYDQDAEKDDGSCINKGKVTFWQSTATSYNTTDVTINGSTAVITIDLSSTPNCDASGCANFSLCAGTYTYTASEQFPGTTTWSGTVTVTADGCMRIQLL